MGVALMKQMRPLNRIPYKTDTHYISYNPSIRDYGTDTTAIYIHETSQFLILAGDHTEELQGLTLEDAVTYFYDNVEQAVSQSEHGQIFTFVDGKGDYVAGGY